MPNREKYREICKTSAAVAGASLQISRCLWAFLQFSLRIRTGNSRRRNRESFVENREYHRVRPVASPALRMRRRFHDWHRARPCVAALPFAPSSHSGPGVRFPHRHWSHALRQPRGRLRPLPLSAFTVAIGGKADIGQSARNDANDPLLHFGLLNCCRAK